MTRSYHTFPRITTNPDVMEGKPCIRGMRVTVGMILGELGGGATIDETLASYPCREREDIFEALGFGANLASFRDVELADAG